MPWALLVVDKKHFACVLVGAPRLNEEELNDAQSPQQRVGR